MNSIVKSLKFANVYENNLIYQEITGYNIFKIVFERLSGINWFEFTISTHNSADKWQVQQGNWQYDFCQHCTREKMVKLMHHIVVKMLFKTSINYEKIQT